jgi:hypothetical protein
MGYAEALHHRIYVCDLPSRFEELQKTYDGELHVSPTACDIR